MAALLLFHVPCRMQVCGCRAPCHGSGGALGFTAAAPCAAAGRGDFVVHQHFKELCVVGYLHNFPDKHGLVKF